MHHTNMSSNLCQFYQLGEEAEGVALPNGKKLKYTLSGHLQFWLTIILMGHAIPNIVEIEPNSQIYVIRSFSPLKLSLLYDNYVQLISISTVGAFALSFYLYSSSFRGKDKIMAKGGDTGNAIYDFFIGDSACSLLLLCVSVSSSCHSVLVIVIVLSTFRVRRVVSNF